MRYLSLFLLCCFLTACAGSSAPTRFYTLAPLATGSAPDETTLRTSSIGVGPIVLPPYLDRQEIVLPTAKHRRELAEFDLWIEPLKSNMTRALSENIAVLQGSGAVYGFPWSASLRVDTQVLVDVVQFDGLPGQDATLIARWTAVDGDSREIMASNRIAVTVPVHDNSYEALANAMSLALLRLAEDVTRGLAAAN